MQAKETVISLQNNNASLGIDQSGGAITYFSLKHDPVNPLSFSARQEPAMEVPVFFKGHFLCLGRWGDPSEGENRAGLFKHGDFARIHWKAHQLGNTVYMQATSSLEGLTLDRILSLDQQHACFQVEEKARNFHSLGRIYNMVQHPTLAAPFLNERTLVDCNATAGFDYAWEHYDEKTIGSWPKIKNKQGFLIDLRCPAIPYSSVFSFIVNPLEPWGWITAYAPDHNLLIGYAWPRKQYPWINMWLHYSENRLSYRGLEFGTTGIHKPFREIMDQNLTHLLNEKTYSYLDAGELVSRQYICFLQKMPAGFNGVEHIRITEKQLAITERGTFNKIYLPHSFNLYDGI